MRRFCESGLGIALLLLPPVLAVLPRGAAPLFAAAGICAAGLLATAPSRPLAGLRSAAILLGALLLWGALSIAWSIDPGRSAIMELRLAGLFAGALALAAAAGRLAAPQRLAWHLLAGIALGIALALFDLASGGELTRLVSARPFVGPRLNQIAACLALLVWPVAAFLLGRRRRLVAGLATAAMAASVFVLADTTAKLALALSLPVVALLWWRRPVAARVIAGVAVIGILSAPLTLPRLAQVPGLFARVDTFKDSAGHRLLIWWFTGRHIAERPLFGWGLDSARAIPGGKEEIRPGQQWLPLHPHDAALQLWLELGMPGAMILALLAGLLWLQLAAASWPPFYGAAAGGSLAAGLLIAMSGWGVWEEWWVATLSLCLFAELVLARVLQESRV